MSRALTIGAAGEVFSVYFWRELVVPPKQEVAEQIDVCDEVADFYPLLAVPAADRAADVESRLGSGWECGEITRVETNLGEAEVLFGTLAVIAGERDEAGVGRHGFVFFRDNEHEGIFRVIGFQFDGAIHGEADIQAFKGVRLSAGQILRSFKTDLFFGGKEEDDTSMRN